MRNGLSWIIACSVWSVLSVAMFAALGWIGRGYFYDVALAVPYLLGPAVVTAVWARWLAPGAVVDAGMRFGPRFLLAGLAPVAAVWAVALVAHALGLGAFDLSGAPIVLRRAADAADAAALQASFDAAPLPYAVFACVQALMVGAMMYMPLRLAEEIGWRGALLDALAPLGFWPAATISAVGWALWHLPLVGLGWFVEVAGPADVLGVVAALVPLGMLLAWVRVSSGTVWAAALASGVLTGLHGFHEVVLGPDVAGAMPGSSAGVYGWAGAIVWTILLAAVAGARGFRPPEPPPLVADPVPARLREA